MSVQKQINYLVRAGGPLKGSVKIPGDKSISHRAIMLSAIAEGSTHISGFLNGEDTIATMNAFRQMGVCIDYNGGTDITVHGVGLNGLRAADTALNVGNSGTSVRLLAGILAGQNFASELIGDASLMKRPMRRIVEPLKALGAQISCTENGTLPLHISPARKLTGLDYAMPVASAQLKSCLLFAGLYSREKVCVSEPAITRDHSERMLLHLGCRVEKEANRICITPQPLIANDIQVPADISSAAFFMVAASIVPGSDLLLREVGVNPTRHAVLEILQRMGADISLSHVNEQSGEPVADIRVRYSQLQGINIPEQLVPIAIDEFPAILVAAAYAKGQTNLSNAAELRVKESDRILAMTEGLAAIGIEVEARSDGVVLQGGQIRGGEVNSYTDHRIAMAFTVAGMAAEESVRVKDCHNVSTSFPGFSSLACEVGANISIEE